MKELNSPPLHFKSFNTNWVSHTLGAFAKIFDGTHQTPKYVKEGVPFYSVEHVTANDFTKTKYIEESVFIKEQKRVKIENGDLLMTRIGDIGTVRFIDWNVRASFYVSLALIKTKIELNSAFLSFYIQTQFFQKELWTKTIHVAFPKKINLGEIGKCKVSFPSLPEQQKIASFLTSVDKRISQLKRKKQLLEQYKKGIMQQIFSQQLRFKPEDGAHYPDWDYIGGGELFANVSNKNHESDLPILAITQEFGAIPRELIDYEINVSTKSVSSYKVVEKGDFIISLRSFQGGIEYSNYKGICSPAYIILKPKLELDRGLFKQYFKSYNYIIDLNRKLEGIRDGKMISYKYFSEIKLPFPCLEEQTKIANFLSAIDTKITQTQKQIELTQQFKKGLLQQMFV